MPVTYDLVPYPSYAYGYTHPDTLATAATLLGLKPAPVERCRVLELGCASGGNIIPMALDLPESRFVGIDYSARQVADGQVAVAALGLKNIELEHRDILEVQPDLGQFDYIIAHGIYSWVPQPVQEKLLDVCRQNLTPHGLAYVSYNTFPGWHAFGAFRQMMLYHTRNIQDPKMRTTQARALLEFLAESVPPEGDALGLLSSYTTLLKKELERWKSQSDSYLFHDELEEVNEPIYFYQFVERAERQGLQYLCDADLGQSFSTNMPPAVTEGLLKMSHNLVEMEQYMDFVRNQSFRRTLLVHQGVHVNRSIRPDRLASLFVSSHAVPVSSSPDIRSISVEEFRAANGAALTTDHPVTKAAMAHLRQAWPTVLAFDELLDAAYTFLDAGAAPTPGQRARDAQVMSANLLKGFIYSDQLIELRSHAPRCVTTVGERPLASPWARFLADEGHRVTNLRHESVDLRESDRYVLRQLDGAHDRKMLWDGLAKELAAGTLVLRRSDQPIQDIHEAQQILVEEIDDVLKELAHAALLIG